MALVETLFGQALACDTFNYARKGQAQWQAQKIINQQTSLIWQQGVVHDLGQLCFHFTQHTA
jgi:hypothetical protein